MRDHNQHNAHQWDRIAYLNNKAAMRFPVQWNKACKSDNATKRKARLRKRYLDQLEFDAWRAKHPDVTCATCWACSDLPNTYTAKEYEGKKSCDYGEGGGWYQTVDPLTHFCMKWKKS